MLSRWWVIHPVELLKYLLLKVPTVNIGETAWTVAAESVFSCPSNTAAIIETLQLGLKSDLASGESLW